MLNGLSPKYLRIALHRSGLCLLLLLGLSGCAETQLGAQLGKRLMGSSQVASRPSYKVGQPYTINGVTYVPREDYGYNTNGTASWYGSAFHAKSTANGEVFDKEQLTAAHTTLPLPTIARITNLENNQSVVVRINDRGPYKKDRVIDVSERTAEILGFKDKGTAYVNVTVLEEQSREIKQAMLSGRNLQLADLPPPPPLVAPTDINAPAQRVDTVRTSGISAVALNKTTGQGEGGGAPPPLMMVQDGNAAPLPPPVDTTRNSPIAAYTAGRPPAAAAVPVSPAPTAVAASNPVASSVSVPAAAPVSKPAAYAPRPPVARSVAKNVARGPAFVQVGNFKPAVAARVKDTVAPIVAPDSHKVLLVSTAGSAKVRLGPLTPAQVPKVLSRVRAIGFQQAAVVYE